MLLSPRLLPLLRVLIVAAIAGVLVLGLSLAVAILTQGEGAPRTAEERAIFASEQAVEVNPEDANARARLASAYLEQGSFKKAIEQAEIALRLKPGMPEAYFVLGSAHRRDGNADEALANLTSATEAEGQYATFYQEVWVEIARTQKDQDDVETAISSLERALGYGPENALIVLERATMLEEIGRWEEAAYDYGYALVFVPDMAEANEGLDRMQEEHPTEYATAMKLLDAYIAQVGPAHGSTDSTSTPTTSTP